MRKLDWLGRRTGVTSLPALLAAGTLFAGCGGNDSKQGVERLAPKGTMLNRLSIAVTEPRPGRFRHVAPKSVRGGLVEIRFKNAAKAPRKAQLWRVGAGRSVTQALRRKGRRLPPWLAWSGGVGLTQPNRTGTAVQRLSPGSYYVTGLGNERRGVASLRVTGRGASAPVPGASGRVTAVDYNFQFSGLKAGPAAIEFRNTGREPHHAFFAPMRDGRTLAEVRNFFAGKLTGPPPVDPEATRETVVLEGRDRQVTRLNLQTGRYAVLCFVRDRAGGPQHTEKGMVSEVKVP